MVLKNRMELAVANQKGMELLKNGMELAVANQKGDSNGKMV